MASSAYGVPIELVQVDDNASVKSAGRMARGFLRVPTLACLSVRSEHVCSVAVYIVPRPSALYAIARSMQIVSLCGTARSLEYIGLRRSGRATLWPRLVAGGGYRDDFGVRVRRDGADDVQVALCDEIRNVHNDAFGYANVWDGT